MRQAGLSNEGELKGADKRACSNQAIQNVQNQSIILEDALHELYGNCNCNCNCKPAAIRPYKTYRTKVMFLNIRCMCNMVILIFDRVNWSQHNWDQSTGNVKRCFQRCFNLNADIGVQRGQNWVSFIWCFLSTGPIIGTS